MTEVYKTFQRAKAKLYSSNRVDILRVWTGPLRLMPDYLIIGAARSGTSSLYAYLTQHPCIAPAFNKEVHFFDLNFDKGLNWYRAHFSSLLCKYCVKKIRGQALITGEASPYYICHPHAPRRISQIIPQVRLIVLLRNPVDRAYSHYHHAVEFGLETLSFEQAIEAEASRGRGEEERILADESYNSFSHRHHLYLARGIYIDQIKVWMNLFPKEQMLILCAEDFYSAPSVTYSRSLAFLNLPNLELKEYHIHQLGKYPKINPSTRKQLDEYFEPYNKRLYEYLGMRFDWDR